MMRELKGDDIIINHETWRITEYVNQSFLKITSKKNMEIKNILNVNIQKYGNSADDYVDDVGHPHSS